MRIKYFGLTELSKDIDEGTKEPILGPDCGTKEMVHPYTKKKIFVKPLNSILLAMGPIDKTGDVWYLLRDERYRVDYIVKSKATSSCYAVDNEKSKEYFENMKYRFVSSTWFETKFRFERRENADR